MLQAIAAAIQAEDYPQAARLLKPLLKTEADNPWVRFYLGRVQEGLGKYDAAERLYLQLLPQTSNPKLIAQIRQGIRRIEQHYQTQHQDAIAQALAAPGSDETGILVLEPIPDRDRKRELAQRLSRILQLDVYTARLHLPSRGWRIYRTGKIGELNYYTQALQTAEIPSFAVPLTQITDLNVFTVQYFNTLTPQPKARCVASTGQAGTFAFQWSDVSQWVIGRVPLFETVPTVDAKHRLVRKTQTQDYWHICDLHLPNRKCILRLTERNYDFGHGVNFKTGNTAHDRDTVEQSWRTLIQHLKRPLGAIPHFADFSTFADSAIDFREFLNRIESHLDLERRQPSLWDQAFHLYSGLAYGRRV
jgi:tetratricopeptide (TPR) repeat protein